jgi:hypothetical protein
MIILEVLDGRKKELLVFSYSFLVLIFVSELEQTQVFFLVY